MPILGLDQIETDYAVELHPPSQREAFTCFRRDISPVADGDDVTSQFNGAFGLSPARDGLTEVLEFMGETVHPIFIGVGELPSGARFHFFSDVRVSQDIVARCIGQRARIRVDIAMHHRLARIDRDDVLDTAKHHVRRRNLSY